MLGWTLFELKSRLLLAKDMLKATTDSLTGADKFIREPDDLWHTSVWRALFKRIIALHGNQFPCSSQTIYDASKTNGDYPYLFLEAADIGIPLEKNAPDTFALYDFTRRALNCLTLLYIKPYEVINQKTVADYRQKIVQSILGNLSDEQEARSRLTVLAVRSLEAWDGELRENYYASLDDDGIAGTAYEAGRSLSALSWGVSLATVPLEQNDAQGAKLYQAWKDVFNRRDIVHIRHQISTLSVPLDAAYLRAKGSPAPTATQKVYLPSEAIQAINRSLDYWQAAIEWLGSDEIQNRFPTPPIDEATPSPRLPCKLSRQLRIALIQQADTWQSLLACRQDLGVITTDSVTNEILGEFMDDCRQAIGMEVTENVGADLQSIEKRLEKKFNRYGWILIALGLGILAFVVLLVVIANLPDKTNPATQTAITLLGLVGLGFLTNHVGSRLTQQASETSSSAPVQTNHDNLFTSLATMLKGSEESIFQIFTKACQEIQAEFDDLHRNVAVSSPQIEVFIIHTGREQRRQETTKRPGGKTEYYNFSINNAYTFLNSVIWPASEKRADIQRVVQAAFGPIGLLVNPKPAANDSNSGQTGQKNTQSS